MLDFMMVTTRTTKNNVEVIPKFKINDLSKDLMIRGGDFYAIWDEDRKLWSTKESDVVRLVDIELKKYAADHADRLGENAYIRYMWDSDSGSIDKWHKYCQKQMRDNYSTLDEELIFSNTELTRDKYASKKLNYPLEAGSIEAYDKLISTLYSKEERHKIEWAIGSIVTGDSKTIQKFMVLYGAAGTGKSTILNIIQKLFDGYYCVFDAKALGSSNSSFALEQFRTNPLVAIQHDGDLSRIEDNTKLNSLVSHEEMMVNEKFKSQYTNRFKAFLFLGTNRPVKITDGKSGLLRRLIDVTPTGNKVSSSEYKRLIKQIDFELGAIAWHCREVYLEDPGYYDDYIPTAMLEASNDFYNFVCDSYRVFKKEDGTTAKAAWEMYKQYCEDAKVPYPYTRRLFIEELKNYFWDYDEKITDENGTSISKYFSGFRTDKIETKKSPAGEVSKKDSDVGWLEFKEQESILDKELADCPAQYANENETPSGAWDYCKTKLSDLDTSKLHYLRAPETHVFIDFDLKDSEGNKSFERNLEAANKWPRTYAELSKGGQGIHLHYIYTGDPNDLSRIYAEDIEVKTCLGKSSIRRRLSKCNDLPIATISSGLPLKEADKVINFDGFKSENALRTMIKRNLNKEIHASTKCSVDFIYKNLEDAYNCGLKYDVTDMRNAVYAFAASSSNQSDYCLKLVGKMKFQSDEPSECVDTSEAPILFYDIEVFPNLFLVCWMKDSDDAPVVRMINPKPIDIEKLLKFRLIGFNNKDYDNHMLWACMMGYTNMQLYQLSKKLINDDKDISRQARFKEAINISYTDILDFASAGNKKSLKKLEIEMGIHHQELGLPWDEPVPEELWEKVADYCKNDVVATRAAFYYLKGDWIARQILADLADMTVNDSTNTLSQRIIFGKDRNPQSQFNYRNLAEPVSYTRYEEYKIKFGSDYDFRVFNDEGIPQYRSYIPGEILPDGWSILPFFPGYTFDQMAPKGEKSIYMGEYVGEGGRVYAEPGIYWNVWDGDVTGQHPSTIISEVLFGPKYTKAFKDIVDARVNIKHQSWQTINELFNGKLKPYIQKVINGELTAKELSNALKTCVNAVYGQTKASYPCPFKDPRNIDNIVAKKGALFMTLLKSEVQKRGYTVCHIKTDSIKIPNATQEIQDFVLKFGKEFGYSFETEAEFERFCLVNDAVYVAKTKEGEWTATGKQFAVPYVFKSLFSKEPIEFGDMCETFSVKKGALYLDMNEGLPDVTSYETDVKKLENKYKKGTISDTTFESECQRLNDLIKTGHKYVFVGRVGHFCPVKSGVGGGVLYCLNNNKYSAPSGSTGFRWLESEMLMNEELESSHTDEKTGEVISVKKSTGITGNTDAIDRSYYRKLVDDAIETISKYGDVERFLSEDPYPTEDPIPDFMNIPEDAPEELPWD